MPGHPTLGNNLVQEITVIRIEGLVSVSEGRGDVVLFEELELLTGAVYIIHVWCLPLRWSHIICNVMSSHVTHDIPSNVMSSVDIVTNIPNHVTSHHTMS